VVEKQIKPLILLLILLIPLCLHAEIDPAIEITVKEGDTLTSIGKAYLNAPENWRKISEINLIKNPDLIFPSQVLRIPISLLKGLPANGTVSFIKGRVDIQSKEEKAWKTLKLYDRIQEGSWIRTDEESAVEVSFEDQDSFFQHAQTTTNLLAARKLPGAYLLFKLYLKAGKTVTKVKEATGRELRFEIDTPSSVCSVRGTNFRTSVDAEQTTRSEVLSGSVTLEAVEEKVIVEEGEGTLVKKGEPPMEPRKLLPPPPVMNLKNVYRQFPLVFEFGTVEGARFYKAILAKDGDFKDTAREMLFSPSETFTVYNLDDGTYFLQSLSIDGVGLEGIPSATSLISVRMNPFPPIIESPVDNAVYTTGSPVIRWLGLEDAVRYSLQIASDENYLNIIEEKNDIYAVSYAPRQLDHGKYYFRISSIAKDDYQGEWSDTVSFTITTPQSQK
jgi:hypothetical protein